MMQLLVYLCTCLLALAAANGYYYEAPPIALATLGTPPAPLQALPQQQQQYQFHTQDSYGQYAYGYSEPLSTKQEVRTVDGVTRGSYSYLDANGKVQTVAYIADSGGFRVAATNLPQQPQALVQATPQPVKHTAEVAAAQAQHLAVYQQAKLRFYDAAVAAVAAVVAANTRQQSAGDRKSVEHVAELPRPVEDTPEVAAAKAEFFKRYEEVKQRNERLQQKQKKQELDLGYTLVKSQPIAVTLPLPLADSKTPKDDFHYGYNELVPSIRGAYLPVA